MSSSTAHRVHGAASSGAGEASGEVLRDIPLPPYVTGEDTQFAVRAVVVHAPRRWSGEWSAATTPVRTRVACTAGAPGCWRCVACGPLRSPRSSSAVTRRRWSPHRTVRPERASGREAHLRLPAAVQQVIGLTHEHSTPSGVRGVSGTAGGATRAALAPPSRYPASATAIWSSNDLTDAVR